MAEDSLIGLLKRLSEEAKKREDELSEEIRKVYQSLMNRTLEESLNMAREAIKAYERRT